MAEVYKSRFYRLKGSSDMEVERKAKNYYNEIDKRTRHRQTFVRSAFFNKEKVFLKTFWDHIYSKTPKERERRLRYYICSIDLITNTKTNPTEKQVGQDIFYRFYGLSKDNGNFIVQIRKNRKNQKFHMSVFPPRHQT